MKLNDAQYEAVKTIDKNVLVSAGAGTGKTRVLVKRYIEILKNGNLETDREIESILAITFTKKAAREMKSRIVEEINNIFDGEKRNKYLEDMERANISTIHSFCSDILRENPVEANLDPNFNLLEDLESEELISRSIDQVLINKENKKVKELSKALDISSYKRLKNIFYNLYMEITNNTISFSEIENNLKEEVKDFTLNKRDLEIIKENIIIMMDKSRKNAKIKKLEEDEVWIKFNEGKIEDLKEIVETVNYFKDFLGTAKSLAEEREIIKEKIISVNKTMETENYPYYILILDILKNIDLTYKRKKEEIHTLDFNDLEEETLTLLKNNEEIRKKYAEKFQYIMVDEFQDTNQVQQEIIYLITSNDDRLDRNNLFVVGDPKQSIYRFRGADLQVFYNTEKDILKSNGVKIELKENYRNEKRILSFINSTFEELMGSKYSSLIGNVKTNNNKKIRVLDGRDLSNLKKIKLDDPNKVEAIQIAYEIERLINKGYKYKDIAILFRTSSDIPIYEEVLKEFNIPFYNNSSRDLLEQREVLDIINGIKAISNLNDDIANIGFLKSPMVGLSDNYIYWIFKEEGNIKEKINKLLNRKDFEKLELDLNLLEETINLYERLKVSFLNLNIIDFIDILIKETKYNKYLIHRDKGYQGVENIEIFKEIIEGYKFSNEFKSNLELINIMDKLKHGNLGQKNINSETSNVVEVMTIHKAKGLEFPIVIVPQLGRSNRIRKNPINFNRNLGIGLNIENKNGKFKEIETINKELELEEEKRVLYVALTRAEEYLILGNYGNSGYKKMLDKFINEDHCKIIEVRDLEKVNEEKVKKNKVSLKEIKETYEKLKEEALEEIYDVESSITQYLTYKECPRKYYLRYRLNLDIEPKMDTEGSESSLNPLDRGSIIHKFIEKYDRKEKDQVLSRVSSFYGYNYEDIKEELSIYIDNFILKEDELKKSLGYDELGFQKVINGVTFRGYIDRINIVGEEIEIIDYKTDNVGNLEKIERNYEEQLQFYTIVLEEILGRKVKESKIYLLESGEYIHIDIDRDNLDKLSKNLNDFSEKIKKNDKFEDYVPVNKCKDECIYNKLCNKFERKY